MKKAIYLLTVLFLGFSFSPGKRGSFFSKIFELQFQYLVIICSLSLTEELETLFVDDAGEIYYIDGFYVDVLAKYEVNVKDPFGEGVAGVEVDWEMNYKKQIAEGTPWFNKVEYLNGTTNENGYVKFIMFVKINTGPEPEEVGGPISPDNLVQNGIYICIDDDPDEPGPAGWPRYKFKNQNVQIASVPTGYSILNNPETYTTNDVDAVTYFALHSSDDLDGNHVVDVWEMLLAEKFSPVLHKHSHDLQQGLQNIDNILNNQGRLIVVNNSGQTEYDQNTPPIHVNDSYQWCTFGVGQQPVYIKIDIDDTQRYLSAPAGQRPLYFHCYYDYPYYFLQYWYFFTMNDIQSHTLNSTYHEGDWEHVSLKLIRENDLFRPLYTNFYQHEGGHTHNVQNCWWSSNNDYSYAGIQQGYDENHTHLHVWLARNSHASYNRYDPIYKIHIDWFNGIISEENYIDNVDYEPNSYNLYFEYDYLEKLGKIEQSPLQQSSNGGYYPYAHGHYWLEHYIPKTNSKSWLAYIGRVGGNWWHNSFVATPAALMPSFEYGGSKAHEYKSFSHDESQAGFGNQKDTGSFLFFLRGNISWQPDPPDGD